MNKKFLLLLVVISLSHRLLAQWTPDTLLNTNVRAQNGMSIYTPLLASTVNGSTYFCWYENVSGNYEMHMQLLDSLGNKLWGTDGLVVSAFPQSTAVFRYDMVTDHNGDAILAFQDTRTGGLNVVAYKISLAGNLLWGNSGVQLIDSTATEGLGPQIGVTPTNDVIVAWNSDAGATKWISFQKITAAGALGWNMVHRISSATEKFSRPVVIPTMGDEFMIQYVKEVGSFPGVTCTMYLNKFGSNGLSSLAAPVLVSTKTIPYFFFPEPVYDGKDGIYVAFQTGNPVNPSLNDNYVQHVTIGGQQWSATGTQAANSSATNKTPGAQVIFDAVNNVTWTVMKVQNSSQSNSGIFVQKLDSLGNVLLGANGTQVLPLVATMNEPLDWQITNNGLIIFFKNGLFGNEKLRVVKIFFNGNMAWNNAVISLSATTSNKSYVSCGNFDCNQVVVGWLDDRSVSGVYAQNINNEGNTGIVSVANDASEFLKSTWIENPSQALKVNLNLAHSEKINFQLSDVSGRILFNQPYLLQEGNNAIQLPLNALNQGLYFLQLSNQETSTSIIWIKE